MSLLRTPLYDWHIQHKGRMVPFGGWEMPVQYSSILEEHRAVRNRAGLFDISHMARLNFTGQDALALIDHVYTNDASQMKVGQVRYGLICNESGGILDDVLVYRWANSWSMVVNASNRIKILDWLRFFAHKREVKIEDRTLETAMLAIQGPQALEISRGLFEQDPSALRYYFAMPNRYRGSECVVSRTGYTGEDGLEIIVPNQLATTLADELLQKGATPCGLGARDTLRLEAAMPLYGHELNEEINPFQAGLAWAVKLDKATTIVGKDQLLKHKADTTQPRRIGLILEGKRAARDGSQVFWNGQNVGTVTSGSFAPTLEKSIAMAYLSPEATQVGLELTVDIRGMATPAQVVPLPFYKRAS